MAEAPQGGRIAALLAEAARARDERRFGDAQAIYRRILDAEPRHAFAWQGVARLARAAGAADAETALLARAVECAPDSVEIRLDYAAALEARGRIGLEAEQLREICRLRGDVPDWWQALGIARQKLGETALARAAYERARELDPSPARTLKFATLVSPIPASVDAIASERRDMEAAMDALIAGPAMDLGDPMRFAPWPHFYDAYHAISNRTLHAKEAAMYRHLFPSLQYTAAHCRLPPSRSGKIRVGLISHFFREHSIGRTSRGFFSQMSRDEFEVIAIFIAPCVDDSLSREIRAHADHCIVVPQQLDQAREAIGAARLDVLFHQDIGMEPFSYFLAFSRLAPVQCVSFGHPDTSGIDTMDDFISNDWYEGDEARDHYTEKLFLLHALPTLAYYEPPQRRAPPRRRADFGLPADKHLYVCPQNLFKFHPDMDALIAAILRRDRQGEVIVIEGRTDAWTQLLRARWVAAMPDVVDRIRFLPRMPSPDYVDLIACADVMLDTVHFNGMNTSLEAFSVGTPVITWPGRLQRGRHTQAMYRAMGLEDAIATSAPAYVEQALALGCDDARRAALRATILERNGALFRQAAVVREFERFFRQAREMGTHG